MECNAPEVGIVAVKILPTWPTWPQSTFLALYYCSFPHAHDHDAAVELISTGPFPHHSLVKVLMDVTAIAAIQSDHRSIHPAYQIPFFFAAATTLRSLL